jgi:hypothetical protein
MARGDESVGRPVGVDTHFGFALVNQSKEKTHGHSNAR